MDKKDIAEQAYKNGYAQGVKDTAKKVAEVPEKDIETKLRQKVEAMGGRCVKWVSPSSGGVPDRIVLLPGGRIYFVETKRPKGGKLSALQKKWHEWITLLGFYCCTIWTMEELASFLEEIRETKE